MLPLTALRKRFNKWTREKILTCCCVVERLETWESLCPEDWEEKLLSPWESSSHGQEYGHLVSLDIMRSWRSRGEFVRALKSEDFIATGSMLNPHPVLRVCLGFRNCELTEGKDYSCFCRVRQILRGSNAEDITSTDGEKLDCEPVFDGIPATFWVLSVNTLIRSLWNLSSLRHKRSNFSLKKLVPSDAITSDPVHMMYVHIEGMIPQFGPFLFEVWRRNQGLQIGLAGDTLRHGVEVIITHPRRQMLESQLRQVFPNKPLRLKPPPSRERRVRRGTAIVGVSSSSIFASSVLGHLSEALTEKKRKTPRLMPKGSGASIHSITIA